MCGIAGVFNTKGRRLPPSIDTQAMLQTIHHRGPDDTGSFLDDGVFLGATRLAIVDLERGHQPVCDEAGHLHLVMNGEIYDHDVLLRALEGRGHRFMSRCDTEVAVHMFEEDWPGTLDSIDGQFAIAAHDAREHKLLLARDRMGIAPLFYAVAGDLLVFASEMKAIFASGLVRPEIDRRGLDAILAFGAVPVPGTVFKGIRSLPPGRFLEAKNGQIRERTFWDISYPDAGDYPHRDKGEWAEQLRGALQYATRRRLQADVPVGVFLSGGIDSAAVASMAAHTDGIGRRIFSIGFPEPGFDERVGAQHVARHLGLETQLLVYPQDALARDLPRLVYHAETPLVSTESVAMMALSRLARQRVKVVLTGEGSDEVLGGYAHFRWEAFRKRFGTSSLGRIVLGAARRRLRRVLGEANPLFPLPEDEAWAHEVFGFCPSGILTMFYWRQIRGLTYSAEMFDRQASLSDAELVQLPRTAMHRWDPLNRSLYVSSRTFMVSHVLAAHSDRALMANSMEGRYPFLDRGVQEFLATVPPELKTCWHTEKYLLRQAVRDQLPAETVRRPKKPFLTPFGTPFVGHDAPEYANELLSSRMLREFGYFDADKVRRIIQEVEAVKGTLGTDERDGVRLDREVIARTLAGMACTFVLSAQLLEHQVRQGEFGSATATPLARRQPLAPSASLPGRQAVAVTA